MSLNELNKFGSMIMWETYLGRGREEINAEKEEKSLTENEEIKYSKQGKSNIENNIIFNLVCYS